nr:hypothetical protein CFP56_59377 [Quercus suber]
MAARILISSRDREGTLEVSRVVYFILCLRGRSEGVGTAMVTPPSTAATSGSTPLSSLLDSIASNSSPQHHQGSYASS